MYLYVTIQSERINLLLLLLSIKLTKAKVEFCSEFCNFAVRFSVCYLAFCFEFH